MARTVTVEIRFPSDTLEYLNKLSDAPRLVPAAVQRGLDRGMQTVTQNILERRLSGTGPYSPSLHKLGERSGALRGTLRATSVIQGGNRVIGTIHLGDDSDAPYAAIHEYGGIISAKNAPFLTFKILGKFIRTQSVTMPARAPVTTEVESPESIKIISDEVVTEVTKLAKK